LEVDIDTIRRALGRLDALVNRIYHWRYNPLTRSGTLVVVNLVVLLVTGVYLLIFYRIGRPYGSVADITGQVWAGGWIRSLHRYASDLGLVLIAIHALRMLIQDRVTGPRARAWWSGVLLLIAFLVCGWSGYVMVWDAQGQALAVAGARMLDVLPIFSESITRAFAGDRVIPNAFFFLNLFLHILLPVGLGLMLWIHVSRIARPVVWPAKGLAWGTMGLLTLGSILLPVRMGAPADPLRIPDPIDLDVFFNFWLPWAVETPVFWVWAATIGGWTVIFALPLFWRLRVEEPESSVVEQRYCTGCTQCTLDCPYDAIVMVPRKGEGPSPIVAQVDPDLCVSCGICAGSCAPMRVGPPGRTGRDQLVAVKEFIAAREDDLTDVVVVSCNRGAGDLRALGRFQGADVFGVDCVGSVHTSVIEYLTRAGYPGVMIASCPPTDCWNREGAKWVEQRLFHDREAELQARVDRKRIRLIYAGQGERDIVGARLRDFRAELREHLEGAVEGEKEIDLLRLCETAAAGSWEVDE